CFLCVFFFFFQAEDGIRDLYVTGVQTCALPILFQEFRLLDHLTTFENVALPLRVRGQHESEYRDNVTELLQWVGLGERMEAHPRSEERRVGKECRSRWAEDQ